MKKISNDAKGETSTWIQYTLLFCSLINRRLVRYRVPHDINHTVKVKKLVTELPYSKKEGQQTN